MKLKNAIGLSLVSVTRQSIFDASYVCTCDNCGKTIVNIATVKDANGNSYNIGLDCKKQLIDKPILEQMQSTLPSYQFKYDAKQFKAQSKNAERFLLYASKPNFTIEYCRYTNSIMIKDDKANDMFPELIGNTVFFESVPYLYKIGLETTLKQLRDSNKIKQN